MMERAADSIKSWPFLCVCACSKFNFLMNFLIYPFICWQCGNVYGRSSSVFPLLHHLSMPEKNRVQSLARHELERKQKFAIIIIFFSTLPLLDSRLILVVYYTITKEERKRCLLLNCELWEGLPKTHPSPASTDLITY